MQLRTNIFIIIALSSIAGSARVSGWLGESCSGAELWSYTGSHVRCRKFHRSNVQSITVSGLAGNQKVAFYRDRHCQHKLYHTKENVCYTDTNDNAVALSVTS